jgi:hypothetical protein
MTAVTRVDPRAAAHVLEFLLSEFLGLEFRLVTLLVCRKPESHYRIREILPIQISIATEAVFYLYSERSR